MSATDLIFTPVLALAPIDRDNVAVQSDGNQFIDIELDIDRGVYRVRVYKHTAHWHDDDIAWEGTVVIDHEREAP